jgi:alpha-tubulin suppressor-like RCC1 family protein
VNRYGPTQVPGADWAAVYGSMIHTCAVKTDGTLWCWGLNSSGEVGDGTTTPRPSPVQVGSDTDWASAALAVDHTCALRTDRSMWCWGWNGTGAFGDGTNTDSVTPEQVAGGIGAVTAGEDDYTIALPWPNP